MSIKLQSSTFLSSIGFGLKLLGAYRIAPARYCWGPRCRVATVQYSTCMDDAHFPSSVQLLIPTFILWQNSLFSSSISFHIVQVMHITHSTMENEPSPAAAHAAPNTADADNHDRSPSVNDSPPLPVLRNHHVLSPKSRQIDCSHRQRGHPLQRPPPPLYHASVHRFNGSSDAPPDDFIADPHIIASYHVLVRQFNGNGSSDASSDDVIADPPIIAAPPIIATFLDSISSRTRS